MAAAHPHPAPYLADIISIDRSLDFTKIAAYKRAEREAILIEECTAHVSDRGIINELFFEADTIRKDMALIRATMTDAELAYL
jgi:hypothetical protein